MYIKTVIVFGATGFQGVPQVCELLRNGYAVKAVSRDPKAISKPEFDGVELVAADYNDPKSLERALSGIDALLFQAPALGDNSRLLQQCSTITAAARTAGVKLIVLNSSMWAPDEPCGEIVYDGVAAMENVFLECGIPTIVFRPTLFMNNLQGEWIKPLILSGVYPYCHKPGLKADYICLEDLAKFMVAALKRPDLAGRKIRVGGPERLTTLQMLDIISDVIGRPVKLEYVTPRQFGEGFWSYQGPSSGLDRESFVASIDSFYTFNNDAPQKPFEADVKVALELIPFNLTDLRTWASNEKWV